MKVAYILEKFPSPTEYFILNEILQFEQNGIDIDLFVLKRQKQHENLPELKQLKATIHYLPRLHYYFPLILFLRSPYFFFRFCTLKPRRCAVDKPLATNGRCVPTSGFLSLVSRLLKSFRYYGISQYFVKKNIKCDHIHAHFAFISVDVAYYLSKILKVNYSLSAHAQDIYTNQEKIKQHLPYIQFLITCTEYNLAFINRRTANAFADKLYRVYHGVHLEKWPSINSRRKSKKEVNVLSIGRLVEKKGLIYLIKATERIIESGIKVHCTIIGEGSLQDALEKYIYANKLHNSIDVLPFVSQHELVKYYALADVFVLPCVVSSNGDRDGLPNVIVEAMFSGVPVISTPVSAIPEVIKHKETGLLVKEKDEQAIAEGIMLLKNADNLRQSIVKNARGLVEEKLDIQSSTNKLMQIFKRYILLSQPQP